MFSIFAVFSLCPLAGLATRYNLTAGGPSDGTFYINAPVFVAGDTERDDAIGSANASTGKLNGSAKNKPLFKTDGTVDGAVLADLLKMLDNSKVKANPSGTGEVKYYSAKNFGQYGTQDSWTIDQKGNAQILVKLFEDTTDTTNSVKAASAQYWQAVYRSINGENDVLTLYMARPYTNKMFNPSNNAVYKNKGDYSQSYLRNKIVLPLYETLKTKYKALDQYVVAPYQLSSSGASDITSKTTRKEDYDSGKFLNLGGWQSSAFQTSVPGVTSSNLVITGKWLSSIDTGITSQLGASGYCDAAGKYGYGAQYCVNNGLDGLGDGWKSWESIDSNYTDKLWLPSGFEVLHTGYKPATGDKLSKYDEGNDIIYLDSNYGKATAGINSSANTSAHTNANRTGLWELNAYERTSTSTSTSTSSPTAWLRSGTSNGSNCAVIIDTYGDNQNGIVNYAKDIRVALHLNLGALKTTRLNIKATNNAVNSLLVLTIMDGDARLAEYSCTSGGTITPHIMLDWNKTYKILATRPFGSSLEVKLNDALQSPTIFACYEISTAENAQMNISFILTGDGSWKNCVVV